MDGAGELIWQEGHRMLELTDVVKEYRVGQQRVRALDGISLSIGAGEFASIVGPSGSGKSTLLHLLGALDSPDSGSIVFQGEEIGGLSDDRQSEFRRHRVGFVFQFFNLLPTLSAWENVAIPKLLDGTGLRKAKPRALELLALVGLAERAEHRPAELSGGQMQRVAVARALIMDPPLILADEPTGNLDSKTGAAILELLGSITEAGNSVVMVTHDMGAAHYCDRVVTLRDGRIGSIVAGEHAGRTVHDPAAVDSDGPEVRTGGDDEGEPAVVRSGIADAQAVRP
jgi:putative ABC transport system ATP-binding protein